MSDLKKKMDQFEFQSSIFTVSKIFNVCKNWSENHKTHAESKIILGKLYGNESSAIIENNY